MNRKRNVTGWRGGCSCEQGCKKGMVKRKVEGLTVQVGEYVEADPCLMGEETGK